MTNPRQSHNQEAIDLAATFRLALESTRDEQYQATNLPSLAYVQALIASSQALQPGSASNPVHIFDDAPVKPDPDQVDISQEKPRQLLEPQSIVPENPPHILRHQPTASGPGNSSPASSSQSRLFSTSASATASVTPPSSNLSATSGPSVLYNSSQTAPSRIGNAIVCSQCKQSGHVAKDHCFTCGETGHDSSTAHCYHCHRIGKCTTRYCVNTRCKRCNEIGHPASRHCEKCSLPTHGIADHCHVCDEVFCKAEKHCNVCEEVGHTSKDHCELCRDRGHTENDHCIKCKQLGHGFHACLESDPVSIELCWTCRSYGHHRDRCRYRHQDELRVKWAYQLNRKLMHAHSYCKCCREQGAPDRHKITDCPKMIHRVGCLKKAHITPGCIQWMEKSRKKGSYKDASTQADLAEYSAELDPRLFDKSEEKASVPTYHPFPNIFTVTSASTQTAFLKVPLDGEMDLGYEIDPMLLNEQSGELDPFAEIDPAILGEQTPIKQETTTLPEELEEETHNDDTVWNFEGDWRDYSRIVGPLRNASRTLGDEYWDDRVSQDRSRQYSPDMIMPTQDQQETFEQAVMTPVIRRLSVDREERECGPSPDQNINPTVEKPLTWSERKTLRMAHSLLMHKMERDLSVESDDLIIVDDYPPDHPNFQEGPCGRSPIRSFSEIRNERTPRFVVRQAPEVNVAVASSSGDREKPHSKPTSSKQETISDRQTTCLPTTSNTTQTPVNHALNDASSPNVQGGPYVYSPMWTLTEIRDERVPPYLNCHREDSARRAEPKAIDDAWYAGIQNGQSPVRLMTETRNEHVPSSVNRHAEDLIEESGTNVVDASSSGTQSDPCGRSPIRSFSEIQNAPIASSVVHRAPEVNATVASNSAGDEKRLRKPTSTVQADKRQKTASDSSIPSPATTSDSTQSRSTELANKRQQTNLNLGLRLMAGRDTTKAPVNRESNEEAIVASSSKIQDGPDGRVPLRNMAEIRNEHVPSHVTRHVPESNAEVASSSAAEKCSTKSTSSDVVVDNRQEAASSSSIPRPATTGNTTPNEGVDSCSTTGEKRPRNPPATVPAEKRQKTTSELKTSCLPKNDNLTQARATRDLNVEITSGIGGVRRSRRLAAVVLVEKSQKTTSDLKPSHPATTSNTAQDIANEDQIKRVSASESNAEVASNSIREMQPRNLAPTLPADKRQQATSEPNRTCIPTVGSTTQATANEEPNGQVASGITEGAPTGKPTSTVLETSAPKTASRTTAVNVPKGTSNRNSNDRVWLDHELYIRWEDLCYVVILAAPNHSTNLKQLYNLVSNWLRNCFPKHEAIHNKADIAYLETVMRACPYIQTHKPDSTTEENCPIQFSIRKTGMLKMKILVRIFTHEFAKYKYQKCWLKYQFTDPGVTFRPRTSFEHLIGIALHQAKTEFLTADAIMQWISKNVAGYNCEGPDCERWVSGYWDELRDSSFFELQGEDSNEWGFREGCGEFFDKRHPKVIFPQSLDAKGDQAS